MRCSSCACENPVDASFCEGCGRPLLPLDAAPVPVAQGPAAAQVCPTCGAGTRSGARFCEQCATPLAEERPAEGLEPQAATPPRTKSPAEMKQAVRGPAGTPERVSNGGRVCRECGYLNPSMARFCADCGEMLVARSAAKSSGPSVKSRALTILMRTMVSVVIASVTALATRYVLSFLIGLGVIP
jgi:ribosomal protein L40E